MKINRRKEIFQCYPWLFKSSAGTSSGLLTPHTAGVSGGPSNWQSPSIVKFDHVDLNKSLIHFCPWAFLGNRGAAGFVPGFACRTCRWIDPLNGETALNCSSWLVQEGRTVFAPHLAPGSVGELVPSRRNSHVERSQSSLLVTESTGDWRKRNVEGNIFWNVVIIERLKPRSKPRPTSVFKW